MSQDTTTHSEDGHDEEHGLGHAVSPMILYATGGALLFLTIVTVAVRYVDAGELNMPIALGIAGIKAFSSTPASDPSASLAVSGLVRWPLRARTGQS